VLPRLHRLGLAVVGRGLLPALTKVLDGLARPGLRLRLHRFEPAALPELLHHPRCRHFLAALELGLAAPGTLQALAAGPLWDALTEVDLEGARGRAAESLTELLRSPALGRLRRLRLACHRFSGAAAQALAGSPYLGLLRHLTVDAHQFGPGALATLAAWPGLARLERLELRAREPAGFDLHLLADAPALSPLSELVLHIPPG